MIIILVLNIVAFLFMLGVNFTSGIFVTYLKSLGALEIIISIGSASLYITRGTSSILINKLIKKVSYKNLFIITFLGSAISTWLISIPDNALFVATLRTFQGIFSGFYWVLINIYAMDLGSKFIMKFKNLSMVTISLNLGGFLGSIISGKIASTYSPIISFYTGIIILLFGTIACLFLPSIATKTTEATNSTSPEKLISKEKYIILFALLSSIVFVYINIGIPLFILELGGSYEEIGYSAGFGILTSALIIGISPRIKKKFSYRSIMIFDYVVILIILFNSFYYKNIIAVCVAHSILLGIVALEKNLWYAMLQEVSKNYKKSIGLLRGTVDYLGTVLFLIYGYAIQTFGAYNTAAFTGILLIIMICCITFLKKYKFLSHYKTIHIKSISQYKNILYRSNT